MVVSVALCTRNGAAFAREQVTSILGQSTPVSEIIVSDDASSDDTVAIIERTVADWPDSRTRPELLVLHNERPLGVTSNFQQAFEACTGELIALSDQDDRWSVRKVETMVAAFERRPQLSMLHTDAQMISASGDPTGATLFETLGVTARERADVHDGRAFETLMRRNIVTGATAMMRRDLLARASPFPSEWVHDEWLAVVAAATGELDFLEQPLTQYRQHDANQIGATVLTGPGRIRRLQTPRTQRNARLLGRAAQLAERIGSFRPEPSAQRLALAAAKLQHERVRSALPAPRIARIPGVANEWRTGRYATCGLGMQDVLRDLVQPV
ncbi:glycosyltransferase family 2 protein [Agromyces badenianii]|uniref:glycosyltransferase family 2 protein n=1 Tax=Agromyces badenianii TaxID=2080742 RepID=UPI000D59CE30|nr:glycosyltransferase family 2 protein [Agromyces badenianii]PWC03816.1 glycosyltransferase family 2 protein [Agromyces badenianii]